MAQFKLHKVDENKFEYINKKGEIKTFDQAKLDEFVNQGKEFLIDGVVYPAQSTNSQQAQPSQSQIKKIFNFTTDDEINFTINGKTVKREVVKKNLEKGLSITVNNTPIILTDDNSDFKYKENEIAATSEYQQSQENINGMLAAAPANAIPLIVLEVKQDPNGEYWFNNEKASKAQILRSLSYGKNVTINGKLIALTDDRKDFYYVEEKDEQNINTIKKTIDLKKIDHNTFYYAKKNVNINRLQIVNNLKKGVRLSIDGRLIGLTPNGLDFDFVEEVDKMRQSAKPIDTIKQELDKSSVSVINAKIELPSYFRFDDKTIEDEENINKPIKETDSYLKMKELQKRLFYLSADSNMINVNADKQLSTFDLGKFIELYKKQNQIKNDVFKKVMSGASYIFDLKGNNKTISQMWKLISKFDVKVKDTKKELGETYLNVGYPSLSDVIVEQGIGEDNLIHLNAPLFLVKANLLIDSRNKTATLGLVQEKQQVAFKPNKELLLYITTKLNKSINLNKYNELFDDGFRTIEEQISAMGRFFKELNIAFDEQKIVEFFDNLEYKEFVWTNSEEDEEAQEKESASTVNKKVSKTKQEGFSIPAKVGAMDDEEISAPKKSQPQSGLNDTNSLNIIPYCFIGIFKTLNSEIFKDYDRILETEKGPEYWQELSKLIPNQLKYYEDKGKDFEEKEIRQIVKLDYSQKIACKLALESSINIVGPAGTGKSQTISNILANFIGRNQSTLFVAEKKTATDVVFNRLQNLRFYCLPIFDKENWNEALTKQIRMTLKRVGSIYGSWDNLNLSAEAAKELTSTKNLDNYFARVKEFRNTMGSDEGYDAAKLKIAFSTPEQKKKLADIDRLVKTIFYSSHSSVEFWSKIEQAADEKHLFKGCTAILNSIDDDEIKNSVDLQNRLFKICKYYDSLTLLNNEMVQILQATEYNDKEIQPIEFPNQGNVNSYIGTSPIYAKFKRIMQAIITAHSDTLALIQKQKGFITVEFVKNLAAKYEANLSKQPQQIINQQVSQTYGQQPMQMNNNVPMIQLPNGQWVPQQQFVPPTAMPQQLQPQSSNSFVQQTQPIVNNQVPQQFGQQPQVAQPQLQSQIQKDPIEEFLSLYSEDNFDFEEIKKYNELQKWWKEKQELQFNSAKEFNNATENLETKIKEDLSHTELDFLKYIKQQIHDNPVYQEQYNQLYGIVDNTNKLENVDWILQTYGQIIALLFPVVIASPNLVCKYINPKRGVFKHIIIDEASMLSLEKAIPILFRGNSYCIVGDSKQLQPLSYLEQLKKLTALTKLHFEGKVKKADLVKQQKMINEYKGVLDFMAPHIQKTTLQYHYRAINTELVKFSSIAFYDNEMIISDNYSNPIEYLDSGLEINQVNGEYHKGINEKECKALYEKLVQIAKFNKDIIAIKDKLSVGIIVFSNEQKNYLENLISSNSDPDVLNMQLMLNQETGEDNSLFIKDVESVQGDERDIILMSLGSSGKNPSEIIQSFGLLKDDLGPNFLNVMTTRARKKLIIFKSFVASDIPSINGGAINYYRDFIKYIDLLMNKNDDKSANEIDNLFKEYLFKSGTIDYSSLQIGGSKSYLSKFVFNKFNEHIDHSKYSVVQNYKATTDQTFDLVAFNKDNGIPEFAIVFDEFLKNIYKTVKQSEFYDYLFLKGRGWKFNKVTSMEWAKKVSDNSQNSKELNVDDLIKQKLTFGTDCYYVEQENAHLELEEQERKIKEEKTKALQPVKRLSFLNTSTKNPKTGSKKAKKSSAKADKPTVAKKPIKSASSKPAKNPVKKAAIRKNKK